MIELEGETVIFKSMHIKLKLFLRFFQTRLKAHTNDYHKLNSIYNSVPSIARHLLAKPMKT